MREESGMHLAIRILWIVMWITAAGFTQDDPPPQVVGDRLLQFGSLPLYIVENRGQVHRDV